MRVVQEPPPLELRHDAENLAILLARRADHELSRRAHRGELRRSPGALPLEHQPPRPLEIRQEIAGEILLAGEGADVRRARRFEIDRDAAGEPHRGLDLGGLSARKQLQMDIALKVLTPTQELDRGQHAVGYLGRPPGDAGREKEPIGETGPVGVHEDPRNLLRAQVRPPNPTPQKVGQ